MSKDKMAKPQQGGYDSHKLFELAKKATKERGLLFIEDVCSYIGVSKTTFYKHFEMGTHEMDEIKALIRDNRIRMKVNMRKKWYNSDNPTLQIALYRLLATKEEHELMSTNYVKAEVRSKSPQDMTEEELQAEIDKYKEV